MTNLTAVSLFAGIGGFDLALESNGVNVVAQVEIDKWAQEVLKKRFPSSKIFKDVSQVTGKELIDAGFNPTNGVITGGFPCQDLSVAGRRAGLAGERSGLFWEIARLLEETQSKYFILENVPGLLSSQRGRDMGIVITTLVELGYSVGWRVLDAQYFGVPQRRRRVFIIGSLGDKRGPTEILFEREGVRGITKKNEGKTSTDSRVLRETSGTLGSENLTVFHPHMQDGIRVQGNTSNTLTAAAGTGGNNTLMVAHSMHGGMIGRKLENGPSGSGFKDNNESSYTLPASSQSIHGVATKEIIRRFTPVEYERLQGFPDNWTEGQADTHRYKQLGNAVAVPVVNWIIKRLVDYDQQ